MATTPRLDLGLTQMTSRLSNDSVIPDTYVWKDNPNKRRNNSFLLPQSMRGCIVGKANSGKTNLITYLLLEPNLLDYDHLVVCARTLVQPEYVAIRLGIEHKFSKKQIRTLFQSQKEIHNLGGIENALQSYNGTALGEITGQFLDDVSKLPDPNQNDDSKKTFFLFDDVILDNHQSLISRFFSRGRHHNVDCVYISQNYFLLDRRSIRENSNIFFIFRQDFRSISNLHFDHVASDGMWFALVFLFC